MKRLVLYLFIPAIVACLGCSDDEPQQSPNCDADQLYDEINETCVDRPSESPDVGNGAADDVTDAEGDVQLDAADADTSDTETIDPACDQDGDGALSIECGGNDCDDNNPDRAPHLPEACDGLDTNCSGVINEGLDCSFYAHTDEGLYTIDPFQVTANKESDLVDPSGESIALLDIDTHPEGVLYGVSRHGLYAFDNSENHWIEVATLSDVGDSNGLAIDNGGHAYITAEDHFFRIDLADIEQQISDSGYEESAFNDFYFDPDQTPITGGDYYSSGDCVISGKNIMYMTSKHDPDEDHLIEIDRFDGAGTTIGAMGLTNVYGLTVGWGEFYGTTSRGELITINSSTGESEIIHTFEDKRWYGMASTPER